MLKINSKTIMTRKLWKISLNPIELYNSGREIRMINKVKSQLQYFSLSEVMNEASDLIFSNT